MPETSVLSHQEDEPVERTGGLFFIRQAPPWLVSSVVHMLVLVILGLAVVKEEEQQMVDVSLSAGGGEMDLDDSAMSGSDSLLDAAGEFGDAAFSPSDALLSETVVGSPILNETPTAISVAAPTTISEGAPTIGLAFSARRAAGQRIGGGGPGSGGGPGGPGGPGRGGRPSATDAAVKNGLEWLRRYQDRTDGSWSLTGKYSDGSFEENKTAATAMALLAFQGAGSTHKDGPYQKQVVDGWKYLLKQQGRDGNFYQGGIIHHSLYTQAQCTIAICELYGMTQDSTYREAAERAINFCVKAQDRAGGWRYSPNSDSDTSVTGWFVMALKSGQMGGLMVPSTTFDSVSRYLDSVQTEGGSQYRYKPDYYTNPAMTAEGLLCRQYLGWKRDDERLKAGVNFINERLIDWEKRDVYYWYYATQVTHHMGDAPGDPSWTKWNNEMKKVLPAKQAKAGAERGSWDPSGDQWGAQGGRLFVTCLSIYMLEVYYRHLPLYGLGEGVE